MNKLPKNFTMERYGLFVRLVNESDSVFILSLRTDTKLSRYINKTDNDIEKQKQWIRTYKEREKEGVDYYFIYYKNNIPLGVNRIYNITDNSFTGGSFVFNKGCDIEAPILSVLIQLDIAFNMLMLNICYGDIRLKNTKILKFHEILKVKFTDRDQLNQYYIYEKETFNKIKPKIEKILLG